MDLGTKIWKRLPKWLRRIINRIDDPFDAAVEFLHCHHIPFSGEPGYQFSMSFLMKNRETTWNIIRPHKYYPNCDPEDKL